MHLPGQVANSCRKTTFTRLGLRQALQTLIPRCRRAAGAARRKLRKKQVLFLGLAKAQNAFGQAREHAALSGRQTRFSGPVLYGPDLETISKPPITTVVPDLRLQEFTDVAVIGGTMAVVCNEEVLHPELLHTSERHDDKAPDLCRFSDPSRTRVILQACARRFRPKRIKVGIHLLKEHSFNYYHWLFECLPRFLFCLQHWRDLGDLGQMAILVDEQVQPQGLEALQHLNRFDCEIVRVPRGELVLCDKLFYVSPFWYSLDATRHPADVFGDYAVDRYAVELVRRAFVPWMRKEAPTRKLYLPRRAHQARKLTNAAEVGAIMDRNGFQAVDCHQFSFREQIELFSSATVVVGASGAAFSNLVFMPPGARALIFSPNHPSAFNYYIFQQQADVAQVQLAHMLAIPTPEKPFYVHDDFGLNCPALEVLIKRLSREKAAPRAHVF